MSTAAGKVGESPGVVSGHGSGGSYATSGDGRDVGKFVGCSPQKAGAVNVMDATKVAAVWERLYRACGAKDEKARIGVRAGVYVYLAANGTSPSGEYTGEIVTAHGLVLKAVEIPNAAGKLDVRRFMRGNAAETLECFRDEPAMLEAKPEIRAKCETYGIRTDEAVALCDWLDLATGLSPRERDALQVIKDFGLRRARAARGGKSLEELAADRMDDRVQAQGGVPSVNDGGW